jgi:hypothetical protein
MTISPLRTLSLRIKLRVLARINRLQIRSARAFRLKYRNKIAPLPQMTNNSFVSPQIHPYPGIGHQLSSWISGMLWAQDIGLPYLGATLASDPSKLFNLPAVQSNSDSRHKIIRLLAVGDERDQRNLSILQGQVSEAFRRWPMHQLEFRLALDQARWDQTPAAAAIRLSVLSGIARESFVDEETAPVSYVALHIRRGDVEQSSEGGTTGIPRWIDEQWYLAVVRRLRGNPELRDLEFRAYASGASSDFSLLKAEGVRMIVNGDRNSDFIGLVGARVLVAAPSSFSFSAGLASKGVVLAKHPWWHHVPDSGRWIRVNESGSLSNFDIDRALLASRI